MIRAKDEDEVLLDMDGHFTRWDGLIGPASTGDWADQKIKAIEAVSKTTRINSVLDLGIGDTTVVERWLRFPDVVYMGVDGCPKILGAAAGKHGDDFKKSFTLAKFSDLVAPAAAQVPQAYNYDLVLLLDVLYHIQDDQLHDRLLDYAFNARKAIALTYSPSSRTWPSKKLGDHGFSWFPRPQVADYVEAKKKTGCWKQVYFADGPVPGDEEQRLVALVKVSRHARVVGDEE